MKDFEDYKTKWFEFLISILVVTDRKEIDAVQCTFPDDFALAKTFFSKNRVLVFQRKKIRFKT